MLGIYKVDLDFEEIEEQLPHSISFIRLDLSKY